MLIFVTGGVRSGKSAFAEQLAIEKAKEKTVHYIATSMRNDKEMLERIKKHQKRREKSKVHWITWEIEQDMGHLMDNIGRSEAMVFDCLTTYVNNNLFRLKNGEFVMLTECERERLFLATVNAFEQLQRNRPLIVVSNEIFYDPQFCNDEATFVYTRFLGKMHQRIVQLADAAYLCENGIPLRMK